MVNRIFQGSRFGRRTRLGGLVNILTVTHFFEAHGGGIERVAGHLCRQFAAQGHRSVWAASREDAAPDNIETVPLACLNLVEKVTGLPMPIPSLGALRRLNRAIAEADAVVVHDSLYVTSIVALLAARRLGKPVLLIQHVADIPFSNAVLRGVMRLANRIVTRPMLRAAGQVVFISETTRESFASVTIRRPPRTLFNGVDTNFFYPAASDAARLETRTAHGLSPDARLMLFVGRFVEKKGLVVLEALARKRPDLIFVLAGRGPIDPARWGLSNVKVRRGLSGERLAALYRAADLLLLPSVGEGFPLVVQEAMACGLPVICGKDTAAADPGASRWLAGVEIDLSRPAQTAERLVHAIDDHTDDIASREEMAAYAAETYDSARTAGAMIALLGELRGG